MSYKNLLFPFFLLTGIFAFFRSSANKQEPLLRLIAPISEPLLIVGAISDTDERLTAESVANLHDQDFKDV